MARKQLSVEALNLKHYLEEGLVGPEVVRVRFNRNRTTYLSAIKKEGVYSISVHEVFTQAPEDVWKMLVRFFKRATKKVRRELEDYLGGLPKEVWKAHSREMPSLNAVGEHHDLNKVMAHANKIGFASDYPETMPSIGWSPVKRRSGISRLGSYDPDHHSIRISARLDDMKIPFEFVASVVFHEMLHGVHRPETDENGYRRVHTKAFVAAEKKYPHYAWARQWERENLDRVINNQLRRERYYRNKARRS